jgi:o-succinylbenzoate synthase
MKLQYFTYSLPMKKPFITSKETFNCRQGVIIRLQKDGITAMGEAAPLPGFSRETHQNVLKEIKIIKEPVSNFLSSSFLLGDLDNFLAEHTPSPSLQFCLFTICSFFLAQQGKMSLHQFLFNNKTSCIPINAVVDLNNETVVDTVNKFVSRGFETIKIKAGQDEQKLIKQLAIIRSKYPHIKLRIDANQSWSLEEALQIFETIEPLGIEYCEEPLMNPGTKSLHSLKEKFNIPIALDESLVKQFAFGEAAEIADVLIIKPMVLGTHSIKRIKEIKTAKIIYTTSLESAVGRLMTASLAAGLGSKTMAHGLATGHLFINDFWSDQPLIKNGFYQLSHADRLPEYMQTELDSIDVKKLN